MTSSARIAFSLAAIVVVAATVACADKEEDPRSPQPLADPETMFRAHLGKHWELSRIGTQIIPVPPTGTPVDTIGRDLVPGRRPTIRFTANPPGAGGRSFCNGYGGPFELRRDSLRFGQIVSSAVGCDTKDSLETRFFRGLHKTRTFAIDSASLTLIAEDGTRLTFVRGDSLSAYP